MEGMHIGCGQITWPRNMPEEQVLSEIAQAGYEGAPCAPRSGRTAKETVALFARFGLKPAPGYLSGLFWVPAERGGILEAARRQAAFMAEVGCTELFVAADGFDRWTTPRGLTRAQIAGHVQPADMLSPDEFKRFGEVLSEVGRITLAAGVRSCVHNHVGTPLETRAEIDALFACVDRSVVFQGPDIGHLVWGGADVLEFCRAYGDSIKALHIKDMDAAVIREGVAHDWDYAAFSDHGIFAEIGRGMVDWPAFRDLLQTIGYQGWIIVETDRTTLPTALESAQISRAYLRSIGF